MVRLQSRDSNGAAKRQVRNREINPNPEDQSEETRRRFSGKYASVSATKKTSPPSAFTRVENRVRRITAEAPRKPRIDPHIPSGDRMGSAASCCGVRRRRKLTWAAKDTTQEKIRPENAAPMM